MQVPGDEVYRELFARRSAVMAGPDQAVLDRPGICGFLGAAGRPAGRLLITDDRAAPVLEAMLPEFAAQIVNVFSRAVRCRALIEQAERWQGEPATAMICRDLTRLPAPPLPADLSIRAVRRVTDDPVDGVALEDAAQACLRADSHTADFPLPAFLAFLRSLPGNTRLFAAVDQHDAVLATAGSSAFGTDANAYFVSTDPHWRGNGVATAMTAAALRWAYEAGAQQASLDASPAGLAIYRRLGFESVSTTTLFTRFS